MSEMIGKMFDLLREMDKKLDDLLYEDDITPTQTPRDEVSFGDDFISEQDIREKGIKIPYNKLEGTEQIRKFKDFLSHVRLHEREFTAKEIEFASYADKNFQDIRISDNSRRILGMAYQKAFRKPWQFDFVRGYMHKYESQISWSWADGSMD